MSIKATMTCTPTKPLLAVSVEISVPFVLFIRLGKDKQAYDELIIGVKAVPLRKEKGQAPQNTLFLNGKPDSGSEQHRKPPRKSTTRASSRTDSSRSFLIYC
jgi:hypothetical protein